MRTTSVSVFFSVQGLLLVLSLSSLLVTPFAYAAENDFPVEVSPPWLEVGTYVEYEVDVWTFPKGGKATLRWECVSLEGNVATINVSHTATGYRPYEPPISPGFALIRVLTDTRELIDPNGTVIGKTYLWIPPFMKQGQNITLEGKSPNETIGTVYWEGGSCVKTCQGYQEVTLIRIQGKPSLDFDVNTGILIMGDLPLAILEALGAQEYIEGAYTIVDTNVDLGPQFLRAAILHALWDNLPIIIILVIFITVLLLLVRRRRKRRQKRTV